MIEKEENPAMIFKIITGELIIGKLNKEMSELNASAQDYVYINDPALIIQVNKGAVLTKWNIFSKLRMVMILSRNIVYADLPDDVIISHYEDLINPKEDTNKDEEHNKLMNTNIEDGTVLH